MAGRRRVLILAPMRGERLDEAGVVHHPEVHAALGAAFAALSRAVTAGPRVGS